MNLTGDKTINNSNNNVDGCSIIRNKQYLLLALAIRQVTREVSVVVEHVRMYVSVARLYRVK